VPALVAAFAYPLGNQLLNRARHGARDPDDVLHDPAACVLLMTLGALPVLFAAVLLVGPPPPSLGQVVSTGLVALIAGCGATTVFLHARNATTDAYRIAAVDATQGAEVGFTLLGEVLLLGAAVPDLMGWLGLAAVTAGLVGFVMTSGGR
jgi:Putative multidrug resistance efflux transporter